MITIGDFRGNTVTISMEEFIPLALAATTQMQKGPVDRLLEVISEEER